MKYSTHIEREDWELELIILQHFQISCAPKKTSNTQKVEANDVSMKTHVALEKAVDEARQRALYERIKNDEDSFRSSLRIFSSFLIKKMPLLFQDPNFTVLHSHNGIIPR